MDHETLSRFLDGELPEDERRALDARLAAEPALAAELESLRAIVAAASALPREVPPPPEAWSAVRARLEDAAVERRVSRAPGPGRSSPLLAAAVLLLVLAGGFLWGRRVAPAPPVPVPEVTRAAPTEKEWTDASQALFAARDASGDTMAPADEAALRENLEIIETAVRRIHTALEEDPSNASLQRLLNAEYRRRSALLRRAAQDPLMRT